MGENEKMVTNCGMNTLEGRGLSEGCNIKINPEGIGFENMDWFPRA